MLINQIAVFLENRKGRVYDFSRVLKDAGINIKAMFIADTEEYGILRAITDDNVRAIKVLKENGFNTADSNLIGFEVEDKPGEMYNVLGILENAGINIGYLYSFSRSSKKSSVILIKVDDNEATAKLLKENGISLATDIL